MKKQHNSALIPEFTEEKIYHKLGYRLVAGIDEVGRGCLAGPVAAAAVIMPLEKRFTWFHQVKDSKLLTPEKREYLSPLIHEVAVSVGIGVVYPEVIDNQGIARAVFLAMKIAVARLSPQPDFILIDYVTIPDFSIPQKGVIDGDSLCFSIACASIVAKVYRDHMMVELENIFPGYGFAQNKGYGTEEHISGLHKLGPSPFHRHSFKPVHEWNKLDDTECVTNSSRRVRL